MLYPNTLMDAKAQYIVPQKNGKEGGEENNHRKLFLEHQAHSAYKHFVEFLGATALSSRVIFPPALIVQYRVGI